MVLKKLVYAALFIAVLAGAAQAAENTADTPQGLYLQAGKLERQGNIQSARDAYEAVIEKFPASEFAVKANDRLLQLLPQAAPGKSEPVVAVPAPLPARSEPQQRGKALFAVKQKFAVIVRDESDRQRAAYSTLYGHRYNRGDLREKEIEWEKSAREKAEKEVGMNLEEINREIEAACQALKIEGKCTEEQFK